MKKYNFLIAYDIADEKRLQKISRLINKKAIRVQYSLYLCKDITKKDVLQLVDELLELYHEKQDDIRIYKIKNYGIRMGSAIDLENPFDFL